MKATLNTQSKSNKSLKRLETKVRNTKRLIVNNHQTNLTIAFLCARLDYLVEQYQNFQ